MRLPEKPALGWLKQLKIGHLILPALVIVLLAIILIVGVILPQTKKSPKKAKDSSIFTKTNKVKIDGGKEIEFAPVVKQISPEALSALLAEKQAVTVIQVFSDEEWKEPHIAGSLFMKKTTFDFVPTNIDKTKYNVYVSADGYDSAEAVSKLLKFNFPYDYNVNLEGGLKAWKDEGYKLEP